MLSFNTACIYKTTLGVYGKCPQIVQEHKIELKDVVILKGEYRADWN